MTRLVAVLAAALALVLLPATAALATYRSAAAAGITASTDTLAPVTNLVNTSSCTVLFPTMRVAWTPSTSGRANGYTVSVSANGGAATSYPVAGVGATGFSRTVLLSLGSTYTISVRTVLGGWTSVLQSVTFTC